MKIAILIAFVFGVAMADFTSTHYENMSDMSNEEFRVRYLGLRDDFLQDTMLSMFLSVTGTETDDLPESFDWREASPECVHAVRDQGHCGSCWAHGASEVLSDRFCIATQGKVNVTFSPQQLVDCDYADHGCGGGFLTTPFIYYSLVGANTDECYGEYVSGKTGKSSKFCFLTNWQCESYKADLFSIRWLMNPAAIKADLMANGPVNTGFRVFEDFRNYQSGIYKQKSDTLLGGHAVKIVGWGQEDGQEYWIVQNSWGPKWGEDGFFRIAFGECGIDSGATSVRPKL
jgi:cathepsin B